MTIVDYFDPRNGVHLKAWRKFGQKLTWRTQFRGRIGRVLELG